MSVGDADVDSLCQLMTTTSAGEVHQSPTRIKEFKKMPMRDLEARRHEALERQVLIWSAD